VVLVQQESCSAFFNKKGDNLPESRTDEDGQHVGQHERVENFPRKERLLPYLGVADAQAVLLGVLEPPFPEIGEMKT
jgi:hypothetical protein